MGNAGGDYNSPLQLTRESRSFDHSASVFYSARLYVDKLEAKLTVSLFVNLLKT